MNRSAFTFVLCLSLACAGCIAGVNVEGAPCPCPDGFDCCPSLSVCMRPGQDCPAGYPPSSGVPCSRNADCPHAEICQAWLDADGIPAGPGQCRHDCTGQALPCAPSEVCEPVPADGRSLSEMHIGWACVDVEPLQGCEGRGCRQCRQVGGTFCDEDGETVMGCFLAIHPLCGFTCSVIPVEDCTTSGNVCEVVEGGARCSFAEYDGDICGAYPCDVCLDNDPGSLFCLNDDVQTCATVSVTPDMCAIGPCDCTKACITDVVQDCPGSCSPDGGAHCGP